MSEKDVITVSISPENVEWIDANYENRSAFIDGLITDFREGTSSAEDVIAQYRLEQIDAEMSSLESQLETLREQREAVADTVTTRAERQKECAKECIDALGRMPETHTNSAVENWAEKADMEPQEFYELMQEVNNA